MNDAPRDSRPRAHLERASDASGEAVLRLAGAWRLAAIAAIDAELRALQLPARLTVDGTQLVGTRQRGRARAPVPPAAERRVDRPRTERRPDHRPGAQPDRSGAGTAAASARAAPRNDRPSRQRRRPHGPRPPRVSRRGGPRTSRHGRSPAAAAAARAVRAVRAGLPERDPGRGARHAADRRRRDLPARPAGQAVRREHLRRRRRRHRCHAGVRADHRRHHRGRALRARPSPRSSGRCA